MNNGLGGKSREAGVLSTGHRYSWYQRLGWAESSLLLLHLLLLKKNFSLGINGGVIHEFLIDMIVELIEGFLYPLEKLMESGVQNLFDGDKIEIRE